MTNLTTLIGMILSTVGMGSSVASQGVAMHQQLHPQQAYNTPYVTAGQPCKLQTLTSYRDGTFVVVEHTDGSKTLECVPNG